MTFKSINTGTFNTLNGFISRTWFNICLYLWLIWFHKFQFTTQLVEVVEDEFMVTVSPGNQKKVKGYGIVLEDTILFAEGGGQVS